MPAARQSAKGRQMKRVALVASVLAVALVGVVTANAGGDPSGRGEANGRAQTLSFTVRLVMAPGHGGPNVGDHHVFAGDLLRGSADVGDYRGFCIVTVAGPEHLQCNVTADVSGRGHINAVGSVGRGGVGTMSRAGGTGAFEHVRGTRTGVNPCRHG